MSKEIEKIQNVRKLQSASINARSAFWRYCLYAARAAAGRTAKRGIPCTIDAYDIDRMLVDQKWKCALSGITLALPKSPTEFQRHPFGPSLDRVVPALGYVAGNVRVVCNMANSALNEWGEENFIRFITAIIERANAGD